MSLEILRDCKKDEKPEGRKKKVVAKKTSTRFLYGSLYFMDLE